MNKCSFCNYSRNGKCYAESFVFQPCDSAIKAFQQYLSQRNNSNSNRTKNVNVNIKKKRY